MTIDFSFAWLDESVFCWISFSSCAFGCCTAVTVHEYFPVSDVANGCHIHASVRNNHGFYAGFIAAYSMHQPTAVNYKKIVDADKARFKWKLREEIIAAKQALIIYAFENGED